MQAAPVDALAGLPSGPAFLALAALDRYRADLDGLVRAGAAARDWERIALDLRELRRSLAPLPALCAGWLEVLLSGLDLLAAVAQPLGGAQLQRKLSRHLGELALLERRCREACSHGHATP